jgi:hypothetical protein
VKIGAFKYFPRITNLSIPLIACLLVFGAIQGRSLESLHQQQHTIHSGGKCAVEAMGQPSKLPSVQSIDTQHILLTCTRNSHTVFYIEHSPYQSPDVTLLSSQLVYTLTTSSYL